MVTQMEIDYSEVREIIRGQCEAVSRVLFGLTEPDFATPTRLAPWDIAHLTAHLYRDFERVPLALEAPRPEAIADTDAALAFWSYDRTDNAVRTQTSADLTVAQYPTGRALVGALDDIWRHAIALLDDADPRLVIRTWKPLMRLDDFAATRVVEIVIHGLDLTDALARSSIASPQAFAFVSDLLVRILGSPLPPQLEWDPTTWIEKASGRRPLTSAERSTLGPLAEAFPVLA